MSRSAELATTIRAANRAGTNPLCPDCEYVTVAVDATRCACLYCGQIVNVDARFARRVAVELGATVVVTVDK